MEYTYRERVADKILARKLEGKGAVVIEGPKWCGKTTTAEQHAKSVVYIDTPEDIDYYRSLVQINPKEILKGDTPRPLK